MWNRSKERATYHGRPITIDRMSQASYRSEFDPRPLNAVVRVPGSKSITNRALVAAALADGTSLLTNVLLAEDTRRMMDTLRALGNRITVDEESNRAEVTGCRGLLPVEEAELSCGNAGTVMRFCTALAALGHGQYRLDGTERMRKRPIGGLVDALRALGCGVEYHQAEGYPPMTVHAQGLCGGHVQFRAAESSQWISALLLSAPYAAGDVFIEVARDVPSMPYVRMTLAVMERFGVIAIADPRGLKPPARLVIETPQRYQGTTFTVEPDATNASYFLAAPAVAGGRVSVKGLGTQSIQGDVAFVDVLEQMGCLVERALSELNVQGPQPGTFLRGVDVDLNDIPDVVPTLAVVALFADSPTHIRNVANLRVKESDRLAALSRELTKLGANVTEHADGLTIVPPKALRPARIETYGDHRLAMSFALAGLRCPGLVIEDPHCCAKAFPHFFEQFGQMVARHP